MKKSIVISVRISEDEYNYLSAIAKANMDTSISNVVRYIIKNYKNYIKQGGKSI